ncbi:MAG: alpha-L-fucosidase C-terminal domain-containing protein, partial [Gemmatimonadales bacterium]
RDIGSWLAINGEAIFETRPSLEAGERDAGESDAPAVRYTRNGADLYAHFLEWPEGDVRIEGLTPGDELGVTLLGYDGPVAWHAEGSTVVFTPPLMSPSQVPNPYAYVFKISGALARDREHRRRERYDEPDPSPSGGWGVPE